MSHTARKGCHHIIDIMKLCSDVTSCVLLSICFIKELQYHGVVTSFFTVGKKKFTKATLQNLKRFYKGGRTNQMPKTEADSFIYCYSITLILTTSRLQPCTRYIYF